ncbi:hypothetical protein A3D81_00085 [Candidatus Curtissbacteria bacterium RIFCSPHIGHO2_02_FULL_40_17]|uniref:Pyridoxamine 5'-phosphate oxidase N-terminal domain-containing protein n=4 Tax=Candidatus Curtissiibacteriota TaxID=1752717 RepID=A0A1F5GGK5_9BACT|nr:MAG: hypothetical protein A2693_00665 [Candidatus Curtissbacteria bacterium RIFCSPHIGHO2_01_FULL_40_12]OGD90985.1 MAG: hypothetical protein A3D81_00085 [Candidatus Curtissbacteria bacterium RIFCSPHIGHO2_02_FULL_40_17]OGE05161.1 MAG: hypothetical protein A3F45_01660 [Candidatus Curtissbacteria bacterium RIFCSPHIGHO2_12_FULL_41_17]OGE07777.1 MAG: hypothetical protein A3I53_02150 [Candidatus Curtissbacteria bacterium RIFCSPLOWO2_02_FULL_40_13b]
MKALSEKAKQIIEKILYITLATISKDGQPWNSPVYCAFDENYNFYWISWRENQHSKNIRDNNRVFIVIYDSTVSEGQGQGVYIQAKAYELNDEKNINNALKYLDGRIGKQDRHKASQFQGNMPRRIYKAVPEKAWVNVDSRINGEFVDKRVEIKL